MSPRPSSQSLIASARSGRARLRALLLGVLLAFGLGYAALLALGVDVSRQLWLAREALLGPESVGIWRDDERLGWAHVAGSQGRQRVVPDFDVTYHIDGEGHRQTPGAPTGEASAVLFLGGSFTFGHGVEDDQAYAARLQAALPEVRVLNAAVNAWGTAHALLKLEQELKQREDIQAVVYGFISHHTKRNYRRKVWLENLMRSRGRRAPMFAVEGSDDVQRVSREMALACGFPYHQSRTQRPGSLFWESCRAGVPAIITQRNSIRTKFCNFSCKTSME